MATELNPTPPAPQVPAAPATTTPAPVPWTGGMMKGTRASLLDGIAKSGLTDAQKALLVEEIGKIPATFDLLRLDFHRQDYNAGSNSSFTLTEL
jgi:hypothetical protein